MSLAEILISAKKNWSDKWEKTLDEATEPKRAAKRTETWRNALLVALASAECKQDREVTNPAGEDTLRRLELDEINCRRRLQDAGFQARFNSLFTLVDDPDKLDNANVCGELESRQAEYFVPRQPKASDERSLAGLTFSGGGIRSATFGLGVLQALSHLELLSYFDYLSTVSGGGYIGAWFAAWIKREGPENVAQALDPEMSGDKTDPRQDPIRFLRQYSNYLTPELGFLSRDTWAMGAIYVRNTLLNLITLIAFVGAVMLVPRCVFWIQTNWNLYGENRNLYDLLLYVAAAFALGWMLASLRGFSCKPRDESKNDARLRPWYREQAWVDRLITIPVLVTAFLSTRRHIFITPYRIDRVESLGEEEGPFRLLGLVVIFLASLLAVYGLSKSLGAKIRWVRWTLALVAAALIAFLIRGKQPLFLNWLNSAIQLPLWLWLSCAISLILWPMGWFGGYWDCYSHQKAFGASRFLAGCQLLFLSSVAGFTAGVLMRGISAAFWRWTDTPWHLTVWATPLILGVFCLVTFLYIGLLGINFPDERREWISRLAGRLLLVALAWSLLFSFAFYVPPLMQLLDRVAAEQLHDAPLKSILAAIWSAITWISVQAARSTKTGRSAVESDAAPSSALELFAKAGPYVFVLGLFAAASLALSAVLEGMVGVSGPGGSYTAGQSGSVWYLLLACIAVMVIFSLTVDVNEFSMHHFYRNRLIRAYLGASNRDRNPNGFTGFDSRDDVPLAYFAPSQTTPGIKPYLGPYPVINAALNLTTGKHLAYQERKAESFIFTPLYCGVDGRALIRDRQAGEALPGYRPTREYAYPDPGIHAGSAIAISGAFASPNMGYHSSPATAFLLTVFNVRLGWWIGNPGEVPALIRRGPSKTWRKASPFWGLGYILKDLSGSSGDSSHYVYLTDGGHFDNMGVYELVRRRCRFIVVCDAEEDYTFGFEGLGNAIRKCRADLGVEIEIDVDQIRPEPGERQSSRHCVVGTIHYEYVDREFGAGILVYLKSSLTGDEPADLLEYSLRKPEFPHQTTLDQFFDESQFESYRRLGYHVGLTAFKTAKARAEALAETDSEHTLVLRKRDLFNLMQAHWYPPSPANAGTFTKHAEEFTRLNDRMRNNDNLQFLLPQFFPEWLDLETFSRQGLLKMLDSGRELLHPSGSELSIPSRPAEVRAGFLFCTELIQLMENVYLDLNLDRYHAHPDNQGWLNLFRHWTYSDMFRITWVITASTFGTRFNSFCRHHLQLVEGKVTCQPIEDLHLTPAERALLGSLPARFDKSSREFLTVQIQPNEKPAGARSFCFRFGLIVTQGRKVVYIRVRRHLRGVGLGKLALRKLLIERVLDRSQPIDADPPLKELELSQQDLTRFKMLLDSVHPGDD